MWKTAHSKITYTPQIFSKDKCFLIEIKKADKTYHKIVQSNLGRPFFFFSPLKTCFREKETSSSPAIIWFCSKNAFQLHIHKYSLHTAI